MTKLTDLQLVLLSTAASRDGGSLMPPAASVEAQAGRIRQAIATLVKRGLAEERPVTDAKLAVREEGDDRLGAFITDAGREAVGAPVTAPAADEAQEQDTDAPTQGSDNQPALKAKTKQALLLELLRREQGASLDEMVAATGWLPHTTRAALTGLRKKGHAIDKAKVQDVTRYSIAVAA